MFAADIFSVWKIKKGAHYCILKKTYFVDLNISTSDFIMKNILRGKIHTQEFCLY